MFTCFSALLEQILCEKGYSNVSFLPSFPLTPSSEIQMTSLIRKSEQNEDRSVCCTVSYLIVCTL